MTLQPPAKLPRWALFVAAGIGALVLALGIGWLAARSWLGGDGFHRFIERSMSSALRGTAEITKPAVNGSRVSIARLQVHGGPGSAFSRLEVREARADAQLERFWQGICKLSPIEMDFVECDFTGPRTRSTSEPAPASEDEGAPGKQGFFSLETKVIRSRETNLLWSTGGVGGMAVEAQRRGRDWELNGKGGLLRHAGFPPLDVSDAQLIYSPARLWIHHANLRSATGGTAALTGEVRFRQQMDLSAQLDQIDIAEVLGADWRLRIKGKASGQVRIESPLPSVGGPVVTGTLRLEGGRLEALPVLADLAAFTRLAELGRMDLTAATWRFRRDSERLVITDIHAESRGSLRIEGSVQVTGAQLNGRLEVGVAPALISWLPGAREEVFAIERGGYAWTTVRLSGTSAEPREDLSPRLGAAAGNQLFKKANEATGGALKEVEGAAKALIEGLFGK